MSQWWQSRKCTLVFHQGFFNRAISTSYLTLLKLLPCAKLHINFLFRTQEHFCLLLLYSCLKDAVTNNKRGILLPNLLEYEDIGIPADGIMWLVKAVWIERLTYCPERNLVWKSYVVLRWEVGWLTHGILLPNSPREVSAVTFPWNCLSVLV